MLKNRLTLVVFLLSAVSTISIACAIVISTVYASTLSKEPPSIVVNGGMLNLSADQQDIDIAIDPTDDLPANGTQIISTEGATDMDINDFPPLGVSVLIQNDTVTVTNHTVEVGNDFTDEAVTSNDDGDNDNEDE